MMLGLKLRLDITRRLSLHTTGQGHHQIPKSTYVKTLAKGLRGILTHTNAVVPSGLSGMESTSQ